jgi:hypothetical protein
MLFLLLTVMPALPLSTDPAMAASQPALAPAEARQDGKAAKRDDPLAAARQAERQFHDACDQWEATAAKGDDTAAVGRRITTAYGDFMGQILKTNVTPNAASLIPAQIAYAGKVRLPDTAECTYVVGKGQSGLIVGVWTRAAWTDRVPHGLAASIGIEPPELLAKFTAAQAAWADADKKVLRVPYTLGDAKGVIEIRRDGARWTIHPDRGEIEKGGWWRPFPKE